MGAKSLSKDYISTTKRNSELSNKMANYSQLSKLFAVQIKDFFIYINMAPKIKIHFAFEIFQMK